VFNNINIDNKFAILFKNSVFIVVPYKKKIKKTGNIHLMPAIRICKSFVENTKTNNVNAIRIIKGKSNRFE
jgi:hypothetical protein